ncbi:ABC transporter [Bifidobacterium lemurum]|uniref:ABC transporter n=1 Tax=Bifidobacterium lemurum TaxID=1603886 RepID=A0A261FVD5_9BIFI|nr:ABC transporter permease subunit [Bifidobacterium lemurum]OZG62726.1 ABC transporter [Bifidobacterium lemurum]QOL34561.1 ABC transporter permease subunit [Bifidobacterium lemurum]
MNVFVIDLKANAKALAVWSVTLAFLDIVGVMKFSGFADGGVEATQQVIDAFPSVVLAVLGISGLNVATFPGFYAVLMFYIGIMAAAYGVQLGHGAVAREIADGTCEFLFTRPRSRASILTAKLVAALACVIVFCAVNLLSSAAGYALMDGPSTADAIPWKLFAAFTAWTALTALVFCALGAVLAACCRRMERAALIGGGAVVLCYLAAVVYDMFPDHAGVSLIARLCSPMRYWPPVELLDGTVSLPFTLLAAALVAAALAAAYTAFAKRDLVE